MKKIFTILALMLMISTITYAQSNTNPAPNVTPMTITETRCDADGRQYIEEYTYAPDGSLNTKTSIFGGVRGSMMTAPTTAGACPVSLTMPATHADTLVVAGQFLLLSDSTCFNGLEWRSYFADGTFDKAWVEESLSGTMYTATDVTNPACGCCDAGGAEPEPEPVCEMWDEQFDDQADGALTDGAPTAWDAANIQGATGVDAGVDGFRFNGENGGATATQVLTTEAVDISTCPSVVLLVEHLKYSGAGMENNDTLVGEYSTDGGTTWSPVFSVTGTSYPDNTPTVEIVTGITGAALIVRVTAEISRSDENYQINYITIAQ